MKAQTIYFDEAGFTGNNLLDSSQDIFVFASIVVDEDEAQKFVSNLIKEFKLQTNELKGNFLLRTIKGRRVADLVLDEFWVRIKVTIADKKYWLFRIFSG